ncbi:cell adhesion molecule Dscam1 [Parasteatoda tepidariorum]|uniref:cell adhesion molecule Dscam1 n=1 Tax=Parasteatoda tepidariorum TaxID=114398 RepID=UPI00077FA195|nr:Down syndrome cell adhesion molecule homolog [Parasteatoda tepidariorum]
MEILMRKCFGQFICLLVIAVLASRADKLDRRSLVFVNEPSEHIDFYNTTGAVIPCTSRGNPAPTMRWETRDGNPIKDVPGLRHIRPDGSLVFSPFHADHYRQDVHASVYRCTASNAAGTIGSRDVHVRGMVKQPYKIQVFDEYTVSGNTAVMRCSIPSFMKDYVIVTSWVRDDSRTIVASPDKGGRYSIFPTGELHIRNANIEDGFKSYRCVTRNRLTGEVAPSSAAGKLFVTDARSSVSPRITHSQPKIETEVGHTVELPCAAQGYPVPRYSWYRLRDGPSHVIKRIDTSNQRITELNGTLLIRKANIQDGGKYVCIVNNTNGQERAETDLLIRDRLQVRALPPSQTVDVGKTAIFTCNVSGHPVHIISWRKDMVPVLSSRRISVSREELRISPVEREDRGMYQCFVYNDKESVQDAAQLVLGDVAPVLKHTFEPSTVEPGSPLSLKCIASGNPLPQVTWTLDDLQIPDHMRFSVGDYVTSRAEVVSFVNISSLRVEDGGVYRCLATNEIGSLSHSAKINVIGPPFVRIMKDIAAVEGEVLNVRCPVAGYPVEEVYWEKNGRRIPFNHRQRGFKNGTLIIREIDRRSDGGEYRCIARNSQGQKGERTLNIRVLTPPVIEPFHIPEAIEEGARSKLLCSVTKGDPPITIQWLKDGKPLTQDLGVTETTLDEFSKAMLFTRVELRHKGNYTCIARNLAASASFTAAMVIHAPPRWTTEPPHTEAVLGSDVILNCVADGFPKPQILWKRAEDTLQSDYNTLLTDAHIHTLVNGSLSIRNVEKTDEGFYMCQASNGIGSGISTVITLNVRVPAHFKEEFLAETVRRGEKVVVKCQAFGDRPISVTWKKDGQLLDKQAEKKYTIDETMTDEGVTSEVHIVSADRRDSSLFTCVAENSFGKDEMNIQIIVQERPDKPFKVTAHESTSRTISISWSPPYSGNSPILSYTIQYKPSSGSWKDDSKDLTASGADSKASIAGLLPATTYHFRVMAENSFGKSDFSSYVSATTDLEVPGGPPLNVQADAVGSHTLRVTWQPPALELQNGRLTGYYVGYKVHGSSKPYTYKTLEITDAFRSECLITNLKRLTTYSVIVQAFNRRGAGPPSEEIKVKTKDNDPPTNPIMNELATSHTSIQIEWKIRPSTSSPIEGFRLYSKRDFGGWQEIQVPGNKREHTFEDLQCGTRYHFYMTAFNEVGEGLPSDTVTAKTLGVAPIAPSQNLFLRTNATHAFLYLNKWNDGGCAITFFVIQYRLENQKEWTLVSDHVLMQAEPFELDSLSPGTWYRLHITAHNDAGSTQAEYSFSTSIMNDAVDLITPIIRRPAPFYTNLAIIAPVVVTIMILISVLIVVCALSKRRRNGDRQYEDAQSVRKEINPEAVQMSEYEVKQDGTYVQAKDSSLYFPSPYATSRVPVFSLDERSSGESSTDGRSTLRDMERPYDVPFAVKQSSNTKHIKGGKSLTQSEVEHMYSFPNRPSSGHHQTTGSHRKESMSGRRWSADVDDDYIPDNNDSRPRSTAISSSRWHCGTKQGGPYDKTCRDGYEDEEWGSPFHLSGTRDVGESSDAECDRDQILYVHTDTGSFLSAKLPYHIALGKQVIFPSRAHIEA